MGEGTLKLRDAMNAKIDVCRDISDAFRVVWRFSGPHSGVSIECADWYAENWPDWPVSALMLAFAGHAVKEDGWVPDASEPSTFRVYLKTRAERGDRGPG